MHAYLTRDKLQRESHQRLIANAVVIGLIVVYLAGIVAVVLIGKP